MNKKVLLFSSGMDSYIINKLEKPDTLLFIDNKSNYAQIERKFIESQGYENLIILDDFIDMSKIERKDFIIPSRNLYFVTIAAEYGDEIILGATAGDRSTDKDLKFAELSSELLNHIYSESHWSKGRDIKVSLKYKSFTKRDLIMKYFYKKIEENPTMPFREIQTNLAEELVNNSFSCYTPINGYQCNRCKPDTRKYLAILSAINVDISKYYKYSPRDYFTPEVIEEWIKKESSSNNRGRESEEIIETLMTLNIK